MNLSVCILSSDLKIRYFIFFLYYTILYNLQQGKKKNQNPQLKINLKLRTKLRFDYSIIVHFLFENVEF